MEQPIFAPPPTYRPTDRISVYRPPKRRRGFLATSGWLRLARRLLLAAAAGALFALPVGSASAQTLPRCSPFTGCPPPPPFPAGSYINLVQNGGFEDPQTTDGGATYWVRTGFATRSTNQVHCGTYSMLLAGSFFAGHGAVTQQFSIPASSTTGFLDFWVFFPAGESDLLTVTLGGTNVLSLWSTPATTGMWNHLGLFTVNLAPLAGQSSFLTISGEVVRSGTGPFIDDVTLTTSSHSLTSNC